MGRGESRARAGDKKVTETEEQETRGLGSGVEDGGRSLKQELGSLCGRAVGGGWVGGRVLPGLWSWRGSTSEGVRKTRWSPRAWGGQQRLTQDTLCPLCMAEV